MKFLDLFKSKEKPALATRTWRVGMWVVQNGKVGILTEVNTPCTIHIINNEGETTAVEQVDINLLRQAMWEEIPLTRRKITREEGMVLGYGS